MKQKIILDVDPGHDDAVAILLAGKSEKIDLLGITVVAGNQTLEKTVRNALHVVQAVGLDVPVYQGCGQPIVRTQQTAGDMHGETGLDGPIFEPLTRKKEKEHAVTYLVNTLMASDGDITVVTCGPMTNVAMAMRMEPRIVPKIKQIVLMGGAIEYGNVTPAAEFNIFVDAEAAYICFTSGRPITMVGLDVTNRALCTPSIVERMDKIGNKASKLFVDLMRYFNASQNHVFGFEGGPLHDPLTIAYLIDPSVLTVQPMNVRVEIRAHDSYGRTNCDRFDYLKLPHVADVAIAVDKDKYWDIVEDVLREYDE